MSTFTTQPFTPQSYNQILATLESYMSAQSVITDATVGAVVRTFFESIALLVDNAYFQMVNVQNTFYINTASGTDLDRKGTDFNLPRFINMSAAVLLQFSGTAATVIPAGTICFVPASGNIPQLNYITQTSTIVGTPVSAICLTTGFIGNTAANTIENIQNNPNSSLITGVTNTNKATGGFDLESDSAYRVRLIAYSLSLSQSTSNAIISAMLNVVNAGITQAEILQTTYNASTAIPGYSLSYISPYSNINADLEGTSFTQQLPCVLATTTSLASYTYNNGSSGVGATITITATGTLTIDSTLTTLGMRIVVNKETGGNLPYNGVYTVTTAGAIGVNAVLTRATDLNTAAQFINYVTAITGGATLAGNNYIQTTSPFATVGISSVSFSLIGSLVIPENTTPSSIVVVIDNGTGSLPFSSVTAALPVLNGNSANSAVYPGVVAAGIQAFVTRPISTSENITLQIITNPNYVLDQNQIQQNVITAIDNYFTTIPIGGTLYRSAIIETVLEVGGVIDVPIANFTVPSSNLTPGNPWTRYIPGTITVTF